MNRRFRPLPGSAVHENRYRSIGRSKQFPGLASEIGIVVGCTGGVNPVLSREARGDFDRGAHIHDSYPRVVEYAEYHGLGLGVG